MSELTFKNKRRRKRLDFDVVLSVVKWIAEIAIVCLLAYVLVWYFGQRVSTVGDSMKPVLENGDVTLLNRLSYNLGRPKRGQVVAFYPNGNKKSYCYIRRIIGLPGETVEIRDGDIYIDGEKLEAEYQTEDLVAEGLAKEPVELGEDEYFVLSDDRSMTDDSRGEEIGNVKRSSIEGKVWFILSPGKHLGFVK